MYPATLKGFLVDELIKPRIKADRETFKDAPGVAVSGTHKVCGIAVKMRAISNAADSDVERGAPVSREDDNSASQYVSNVFEDIGEVFEAFDNGVIWRVVDAFTVCCRTSDELL